MRSLLVVCVFYAQADCAVTLEELDRILTRAPNLETFLSDQKLVVEYYQALGVYPCKFPDAYESLKNLKWVSTKFQKQIERRILSKGIA